MPPYVLSAVRRVRELNLVKLPSVARFKTALPPRAVRWAMRTGLAEGIMAQLWLSFAYGTVITGLALLLGAGSFELGVMGALPVIGSLVQVPAALLIEHYRNRRKMAIIGSLGRLLWLVPALVIFLPIPTGMKLTAFLLAIVTGQLMLGIANNAWLDWMTDLIPAEVRGRYFGTRMMLMNAVALVVGLGGASLVDWSKRSGLEAWAYALLLTLAAFGGGLASFLLTKQPEPSIQHPATCGARDLLLMPLRHVDFRKFAGTFVIFQFGLGLGAPFFIAYALEVLGYPLRVVALLDATIAVFGMLAQTQWGKLADKFGQRQVLRICMLLVVPLPLFWLAASPERIWPLFIGNALGGIAWSGMGMAQINRLMEQAPCEGRCSYMATFSVATGVPFMLAALGAGTLMSMIGLANVTLLGLTFHPYLAFFVASGACRLAALVVGWRNV
jgi:MFS family permease